MLENFIYRLYRYFWFHFLVTVTLSLFMSIQEQVRLPYILWGLFVNVFCYLHILLGIHLLKNVKICEKNYEWKLSNIQLSVMFFQVFVDTVSILVAFVF